MAEPGKQGSKVVLLANDSVYFEVLAKEGATVSIMAPFGRMFEAPLAELEARGLTVRHAHKLVKTDGSWLYMARGEHGTDIYQQGKFSPASPLGMTPVRTL